MSEFSSPFTVGPSTEGTTSVTVGTTLGVVVTSRDLLGSGPIVTVVGDLCPSFGDCNHSTSCDSEHEHVKLLLIIEQNSVVRV